jgi:putative FmdB family regulatory protein
MPIYEFQCTKCGTVFEAKRSFGESSAPATCPSCGGSAEKLVSVFASTSGFGVKIPDKEAFRKPVRKKKTPRVKE